MEAWQRPVWAGDTASGYVFIPLSVEFHVLHLGSDETPFMLEGTPERLGSEPLSRLGNYSLVLPGETGRRAVDCSWWALPPGALPPASESCLQKARGVRQVWLIGSPKQLGCKVCPSTVVPSTPLWGVLGLPGEVSSNPSSVQNIYTSAVQ